MPPLLWADFPVQYLVPLVFFVIWIVNQIFGQDGKGKATVRREVSRQPGRPSRGPVSPPARSDEPMMSWSDRMGSEPAKAPAAPPRDEFLAIGPERTPKRPANRQGRGKAKQQAKVRQVAEARPELGEIAIPALVGAKPLEPGRNPDGASGPISPEMDSLFRAIQDPAKVREAIVLNEILQPPVALRGRSAGKLMRSGGVWSKPTEDG